MPVIIQSISSRANVLTKQWAANVRTAGGGFESNSINIANNFVSVLSHRSYYAKVKYLLPMLGIGINAARVPLIDVLGVGTASNVNFLNADFSQSTGLQGNGSTKYLDSLIKPAQLGGSTSNAGLGFWENNYPVSPVFTDLMGCYSNDSLNRFTLDIRPTVSFFFWSAGGNSANQVRVGTNGNYYGNRSSDTSRQLFLNGSSLSVNTTSDMPSGMSDRNMLILAGDEAGSINYWSGRCALAYMTDGSLSIAETADLHSILASYLMIPTGKPQ